MKTVMHCISLSLLMIAPLNWAAEYHVAKQGSDSNNGTNAQPFLTISRAAQIAEPGDIITVHQGIYREWINPKRGGSNDNRRIIYRSAPGEKVQIKGSEVISGWKKVKEGVWKVVLPDSFFGDHHPYRELIHGDWFNDLGRIHHTGEIFLNGNSLYESETLAKVYSPLISDNAFDPKGVAYTWYCESNKHSTTLWANFHQYDPNENLVEISTRKTCFYPDRPGINYLTIRGFEFSQAATQWGAPTAEQIGMIATHWNKGWIIEDNVIHDSKCSGITLGKERGTGHNTWTADEGNINRDGNIHYIEVVFNVMRNNWDKEHIGSHVVRNNIIYNCEQTGICGSMGAVFSTIEKNHIYNIWTKRQFTGFEIAGIKFHAPVDAVIRKNRIHNCGRGLWLDWMVQGTRVSGNLLYNNDLEDLFVEVSHGPYIVDNNIMLSHNALRNWSQGGAYIHNLIAGSIEQYYDPDRFTPYFLPHSIHIAGLTLIKGGDDRFYNNILIGRQEQPKQGTLYGLSGFNNTVLPVWIKNNIYYNNAASCQNDSAEAESKYNPELAMIEEGENIFLEMHLPDSFDRHKVGLISTKTLGKTQIAKAPFDRSDGSTITFQTDYFGRHRKTHNNPAGPFAEITAHAKKVKLKIW